MDTALAERRWMMAPVQCPSPPGLAEECDPKNTAQSLRRAANDGNGYRCYDSRALLLFADVAIATAAVGNAPFFKNGRHGSDQDISSAGGTGYDEWEATAAYERFFSTKGINEETTNIGKVRSCGGIAPDDGSSVLPEAPTPLFPSQKGGDGIGSVLTSTSASASASPPTNSSFSNIYISNTGTIEDNFDSGSRCDIAKVCEPLKKRRRIKKLGKRLQLKQQKKHKVGGGGGNCGSGNGGGGNGGNGGCPQSALQPRRTTRSSIRRIKSDSAASSFAGAGGTVHYRESLRPPPVTLDFQPTAFRPGPVTHFWECPLCYWRPISDRARGSVVYQGGVDAPSIEDNHSVRSHIMACSRGIVEAPQMQRPEAGSISPHSPGRHQREEPEALASEESKMTAEAMEENGSLSFKLSSIEVDTMVDAAANGPGSRESTTSTSDDIDSESNESTTVGGTGLNNENEEVENRLNGCPALSGELQSLVRPSEDAEITAMIDIFILAETSPCRYNPSQDDPCRPKGPSFDAGFPGLTCRHCDKRWFYDNDGSWARAIPRIGDHILACRRCPAGVKENVRAAKMTQDQDRSILRAQNVDDRSWGTRRLYAGEIWKRLQLFGR